MTDEFLEPIRAELFSIERLEQHAESLAAAQTLAAEKTKGRRLLPRVKENSRVLRMGYEEIARAIHEERVITPAAEWLVDNFHIVEEQIREIIDDLPPGYYKELPKLAAGHLEGYPRIFGVAWAFVAHTDSRLDPDWLRRFVKAYQRPEALHIGEIWALAISLRIILVENLRRMTERIVASKSARQKANELADALLELKGAGPAPELITFEKAARSRAFAVQLVQRLRDQEGRVAPALQWLDQQLALQQTTAEDIVRLEHQAQAAMNTTVRNVITSMRMLSAMDWAQFFEDVSVVDEILCAESRFAAMDFPTRDFYRHAIEELARGSELTEIEVTRRALRAAKAAAKPLEEDVDVQTARLSDPGYYLISRGRIPFEKELGFHVPLKTQLLRLYITWATPAYLGTLAFVTAVLLAIPLGLSFHAGTEWKALLLLAFAGLIPASDLAMAVVNRLVTDSLGPRTLPKLDFKMGIPENYPTLLVIPSLLTNIVSLQEHLERLEIHYLSNPEGHLQFALLTDWADASAEHQADDAVLLKTAREGIRQLNERYPWSAVGPESRFFIFHRRRQWNPAEGEARQGRPSEGVWMGWERKRGKLQELNHLLRGDKTTSFLDVREVPARIRYVITLDADTRLARGTAYELAGAMAHPLNRPRFNAVSGRVVEGYGLMQPRITPTLPTLGFGSLYQRIYSGPAGIDPYAFAVSDVYQDLFKEGSYVGKGIYDVDAFEASLAGRVPENTLLSHDLLEGLFARTALVTEIELFEEFPSHYEVAVARSHRWARGDWQLLPWLFGKAAQGSRGKLPWIGRWKIIDNFRRSLSAPAAYLTLLAAWILKKAPAGIWTGFILATLALPYLLPVILTFFSPPRHIRWSVHLQGVWSDLKLAVVQSVLALTFLPHQAWVMGDAIGRTLYRLTISRRNLLEWTSAELSKSQFDTQLPSFYSHMSKMFILVLLPAAWGVGLPFVALWTACPWIAQRLSLPLKENPAQILSPEDRLFFRCIARMTWRFFETFVTEKHHFLPPDNFQEIPEPVEAHRTSPTNIGLYLLSVIAAREFGWVSVTETVERLERTLTTVKSLKQHEGHLFNWYDTYDLRPLEPLYISTVDSGNLAGHLWAVSNACRRLAVQPLEQISLFLGMEDTLTLIDRAVSSIQEEHRSELITGTQLEDALREFRQTLEARPAADAEWNVTLAALEKEAATLTDMAATLTGSGEVLIWCEFLSHQIQSHRRDFEKGSRPSSALTQRLFAIARDADQLVQQMRFGFLCDPIKKIFSIGYQMAEQKLDPSYYDLLASEARLASFVAIAKGDVPALHWFHLSRSLISAGGGLVLLSWSGSMFEYLMPALVMQPPVGSLLDQTCRHVVRRQMAYGAERDVPWGISEAGYNAQDLEFTYQYSNFGIPGLGLKRGLSDNLVVAPYATALAAMVAPVSAVHNFRRLAEIGAEGRYGFYESLDYTEKRLPEDQKVSIVQEYMAHHQGMSLVALANVLCHEALRHDFHAEPQVQATELLLQERTPRGTQIAQTRSDDSQADVRSLVPPVLRRFYSPHDVMPRTHLLSNGRYSVMITAAGSGYSRWRHLAVTRWREDTTRDASGTYIFLRDMESGNVWSAGFQPSGVEAERYEVDFSEDRAEIIRHDGDFITTLEVVVSPEDDAEIRRVTLKNTSGATRDVELTSYAEIVLATPAADLAHPAFSNLFVQTEFVPAVSGLLCTRRPRAPEEPTVWAAHVVVVDGDTIGEVEYESDRAHFLGRGRGVRTPRCVIDGKPLSNTAGAVLDPIVSLRRRVRLKPGETVRVIFSTMIALSRDEIMGLADKYHDLAMFERTVTLAWTQAHIQQYHLGLEPSEAHLFQDLASRVLYAQNGLRAAPDILARNTRGAPGLWAYGISGDLPIVLIRIDEEDDKEIVREMLRAHEYWRMKNLAVDLIILNERASSYTQELQAMLETMVEANQETLRQETQMPHGSIFVLRGDILSLEDRILLLTAARVILLSRQGTLSQQMARLEGTEKPEEASFFQPSNTAQLLKAQAETLREFLRSAPRVEKETAPKNSGLQFFNGLGGFSDDGREYVVTLYPDQCTPAPWINVIANPQFGFQVSESGSGYTWAMNSRENQLTPWSNDPVSDPSGEVFYIRDEETGDVWTPTALPIREETAAYTARHGQGYSRFEHVSHAIRADLLQFVPVQDPIKLSRLRLTNQSKRTRRLSVTAYLEWALGASRAASAPFIVTEHEKETGALLARNAWNTEFSARTAFAGLAGHPLGSWTTDRMEFIGRNGTLAHPVSLARRMPLSERSGAGLDPCAALQTVIELKPGASADILFLVGQANDREGALRLIRQYQTVDVDLLLAEVQRQWDGNLGAIQVRTPDRAMDLMLNRWLLYQTLVCRLWARAAFYQAGGAYGFRDQLQDVMALIVPRRDLARDHILRAAARQFKEGDVQHWWHPPTGRGVRTHISDDLAWLPYVVHQYLEVTQDTAILDETIPFLEGLTIPAGKEDAYFQPQISTETGSLFEHCARALDHCLSVGSHGLPLMGSGDWNDGMNRVGAEGRGESIWLAWFLHTTLWEFAKVAEIRGDTRRAETWRLHVGELKAALERNGWDGEWYRRAYFDDGTPLGSSTNTECQIDSIAQSWGVLSGAADPARATRAMAALEKHLIRPEDKLILLFTPPFNQAKPNPGYIQSYLPGVRENGGQYTHAAVWAVLAFAAQGDGDKAGRLFSLLNPINHGSTRADIQRYKVEPYVAAGDIYAEDPHTGRGGWTWYTGSAGWMYRAGIESILGFRLRGTTLFMDPCVPKAWPGFELSFRYHSARYDVQVENPKQVSRGVQSVEVDGKPVRGGAAILLVDDRQTHQIRIVLG